MNIIFIEHLTVFRLFSLFLSRKTNEEIFYFDASFFAKTFLKFFKPFKRVKPYDFNISELRDENNESLSKKIFREDLFEICDGIRIRLDEKSRFFNAMGKMFDREKISIFYAKIAAFELIEKVTFINVISRHRQINCSDKSATIEFFAQKTPLFEELKARAYEKHELNLIPVFSLRPMFKISGMFLKNSMILIGTVLLSAASSFKARSAGVLDKTESKPKIAAAYRYYGVTFELNRRCDFPWLVKFGIPLEQALIYFEDKHKRFPAEEDLLNIKGLKSINFISTFKKGGIEKHMPVYEPTLTTARQALRVSMKLFLPALKEIFMLGFSGLYRAGKVLYFINQYSKAYDFYVYNNIKVGIDRDFSDPYLIAEEIALRDAGGISVTYQEANWLFPQANYASCADVIFLFGPHYYPIISRSNSLNDTVVFCGFLTDYSFEAVKKDSTRLRQGLLDNGAKFIVSYFDEKSGADRMSYITNKKMESVYKRLFEWVIADSEAGLILSPKEPATLPRRMSGISDLIKRAVNTGRCIFMEGKARTRSWPTEAAQAADLAVASLEGGTTALESFLSGVRTVYFDLIGLNFSAEYKLGRNKIVFNEIDELISAIEKCRANKNSFDEFGNITLIRDLINSKDPFRDGKAAERMGAYLKSLLDSLSDGKSRQEAIDAANAHYTGRWSSGSLICERRDFFNTKALRKCHCEDSDLTLKDEAISRL
ncbi:MAG: hypothetical protein V1933_03675 [Candidatus Omnitrophota bacterium]